MTNKGLSVVWLGITLSLVCVAIFGGLGLVWSLVSFGFACAFAVGTIWSAAEHRESVNLDNERQRSIINITTEDLRKHEVVGKFTDMQIRYMMSLNGPIVDVTGEGKVTLYRLLTGEVSNYATEHFLAYKDANYLRPERYYQQDEKWPNGDNKRESARAIILHCIQKKYAAGPEFGRKAWIGNGRALFAWEVDQGIEDNTRKP